MPEFIVDGLFHKIEKRRVIVGEGVSAKRGSWRVRQPGEGVWMDLFVQNVDSDAGKHRDTVT